jgi:hypothetical protein
VAEINKAPDHEGEGRQAGRRDNVGHHHVVRGESPLPWRWSGR